MDNMSLAALLTITITPFAAAFIFSIKGSQILTPLSFIAVSGIFIAILTDAMAAHDELIKYKDS